MKAIILAAGRGSRMGELTNSIPKPLIDFKGKPLLSYKLEALPQEITEAIIIVGYMGDAVRERFGSPFTRPSGDSISLLYIEQPEPKGTGDAISRAIPLLGDEYALVVMGDDIYDSSDLSILANDAAAQHWSMLFHMGLDDTFTYTGACVIDKRFSEIPLVAIKNGSETGLPQTLAMAAMKFGVDVRLRFTQTWRKMNKPEDLEY
jgi:dTDP-glucose pyrophosphorylase